MNDTALSNAPAPRPGGIASRATRHSGPRVLTAVGLVVTLTVSAAIALYFQIGARRTAPPAYPAGVGVEQRGVSAPTR